MCERRSADEKSKGFIPNLEQELVLDCISLDRAKDERISEILEHGVNWQVLLQTALDHGVFPLLFFRVKEVGEKYIPPEEMSHWKALFNTNAQRNLWLAGRLLQVTNLLSKQKIDYIAFKGPVLALQGYNDLSRRQFIDLDILIHPEDFNAINDLLVNSEFDPEFRFTQKQQEWMVRFDNEFLYTSQDGFLDVHWKIAENGVLFPLNPNQFWQESISIQVCGWAIHSLSPENTILLTCIHAAKHGWNGLKWIVDLAHLVQSYPNIDWTNLLEYAKRNGFHRLVCLGLMLAENPGGVGFDIKVHELVHNDEHAEHLASMVRRRLLKDPDTSSLISNVGYYLEARERFGDRLYYILDKLFVPRQVDFVIIPLPRSFFPVYYLVNPVRLLFKFGSALFSSLFKSKSF